MAWTGFGGKWTDGVHEGGDSSGSIGGGGIKLDGKGNPMGTRTPTAADIAAQWNSYGGTQITPDRVSNIRSDGEGGFAANIAGMNWATRVGNDGSLRDNSFNGFTGVGTPTTSNGKGADGGMNNWNDAANSIRSGTIPKNFRVNNGKVGVQTPLYKRISVGHGEWQDVIIGDQFLEVPSLTKAYNEGIQERAELQNAVKFTSDFMKEVTSKFGASSAAIAQELAEAAKGKKIKNIDQALAAFNRYQNVVNTKYGAADRAAIANALRSLDRAQAAKNLAKFSKGFGYTSNLIDAYDVFVVEVPKALETANWRPVFVKVEAIAAGAIATTIAAWAFAAIAGVPMGILGFALMIAFTGALVDEAVVEKINRLIGL
ncbi:colicin-like pore-forming protein [Atlantibacter hermannii]|uniref:colicin-like pore-forming protein n=1 Tax=Atlantibacter hermannii TaxID=565 RepID=UPI002DB68442|nr:colicin-like pore-forming protein [Atlantibacter hermannii]MEB7926091.1 colicin-like pore-forming protein [Atlantibacter hermannii]